MDRAWPPGGEQVAIAMCCQYKGMMSVEIICGKHCHAQTGDMICCPDMKPHRYLWPVNGAWVCVNQWGKMAGWQAKELANELVLAGAIKIDWLVIKGSKQKQILYNPIDVICLCPAG